MPADDVDQLFEVEPADFVRERDALVARLKNAVGLAGGAREADLEAALRAAAPAGDETGELRAGRLQHRRPPGAKGVRT